MDKPKQIKHAGTSKKTREITEEIVASVKSALNELLTSKVSLYELKRKDIEIHLNLIRQNKSGGGGISSHHLASEMDHTFHKISEAFDEYDSSHDKYYAAFTTNQKEFYGVDLFKINKRIQRHRDTIKDWLNDGSIKDKEFLDKMKLLIDEQMQRYKAFERECKAKKYSDSTLRAQKELTPLEKDSEEASSWLTSTIQRLQQQIDLFELDIDSILNAKKKKFDKSQTDEMEHLKKLIKDHKAHIGKLETILRILTNLAADEADVEVLKSFITKINIIKEDMEYYLEAAKEPEFEENEFMYEEIDEIIKEMSVNVKASATVIASRSNSIIEIIHAEASSSTSTSTELLELDKNNEAPPGPAPASQAASQPPSQPLPYYHEKKYPKYYPRREYYNKEFNVKYPYNKFHYFARHSQDIKHIPLEEIEAANAAKAAAALARSKAAPMVREEKVAWTNMSDTQALINSLAAAGVAKAAAAAALARGEPVPNIVHDVAAVTTTATTKEPIINNNVTATTTSSRHSPINPVAASSSRSQNTLDHDPPPPWLLEYFDGPQYLGRSTPDVLHHSTDSWPLSMRDVNISEELDFQKAVLNSLWDDEEDEEEEEEEESLLNLNDEDVVVFDQAQSIGSGDNSNSNVVVLKDTHNTSLMSDTSSYHTAPSYHTTLESYHTSHVSSFYDALSHLEEDPDPLTLTTEELGPEEESPSQYPLDYPVYYDSTSYFYSAESLCPSTSQVSIDPAPPPKHQLLFETLKEQLRHDPEFRTAEMKTQTYESFLRDLMWTLRALKAQKAQKLAEESKDKEGQEDDKKQEEKESQEDKDDGTSSTLSFLQNNVHFISYVEALDLVTNSHNSATQIRPKTDHLLPPPDVVPDADLAGDDEQQTSPAPSSQSILPQLTTINVNEILDGIVSFYETEFLPPAVLDPTAQSPFVVRRATYFAKKRRPIRSSAPAPTPAKFTRRELPPSSSSIDNGYNNPFTRDWLLRLASHAKWLTKRCKSMATLPTMLPCSWPKPSISAPELAMTAAARKKYWARTCYHRTIPTSMDELLFSYYATNEYLMNMDDPLFMFNISYPNYSEIIPTGLSPRYGNNRTSPPPHLRISTSSVALVTAAANDLRRVSSEDARFVFNVNIPTRSVPMPTSSSSSVESQVNTQAAAATSSTSSSSLDPEIVESLAVPPEVKKSIEEINALYIENYPSLAEAYPRSPGPAKTIPSRRNLQRQHPAKVKPRDPSPTPSVSSNSSYESVESDDDEHDDTNKNLVYGRDSVRNSFYRLLKCPFNFIHKYGTKVMPLLCSRTASTRVHVKLLRKSRVSWSKPAFRTARVRHAPPPTLRPSKLITDRRCGVEIKSDDECVISWRVPIPIRVASPPIFTNEEYTKNIRRRVYEESSQTIESKSTQIDLPAIANPSVATDNAEHLPPPEEEEWPWPTEAELEAELQAQPKDEFDLLLESHSSEPDHFKRLHPLTLLSISYRESTGYCRYRARKQLLGLGWRYNTRYDTYFIKKFPSIELTSEFDRAEFFYYDKEGNQIDLHQDFIFQEADMEVVDKSILFEYHAKEDPKTIGMFSESFVELRDRTGISAPATGASRTTTTTLPSPSAQNTQSST